MLFRRSVYAVGWKSKVYARHIEDPELVVGGVNLSALSLSVSSDST
jgi:hypothetical protein